VPASLVNVCVLAIERKDLGPRAATSGTGWLGKTYRLSPSVACARVHAERRWRGHCGDTKLVACTRQGNKERRTARNDPTALVRHC
jgi:hypothetical protein